MQYSLLSQYMINAGQRIETILDSPPILCPANPQTPDSYDIRFSDVSFAYSTHDVLSHIDLSIREKTMTALEMCIRDRCHTVNPNIHLMIQKSGADDEKAHDFTAQNEPMVEVGFNLEIGRAHV